MIIVREGENINVAFQTLNGTLWVRIDKGAIWLSIERNPEIKMEFILQEKKGGDA